MTIIKFDWRLKKTFCLIELGQINKSDSYKIYGKWVFRFIGYRLICQIERTNNDRNDFFNDFIVSMHHATFSITHINIKNEEKFNLDF